jgi:hypothetical protein
MCYSVESNYNNWLVALFGAIMLLVQGVKKENSDNIWISVFTLTFTQMQVLEAIIWAHLDNKNQEKADQLAKYFVPLLWAQPLVQHAMAYLATENTSLIPMLLTTFSLMIYDVNKAFTSDTFNVSRGKKGHLVWNRYRDGKKISVLSNDLFGGIYLIGLVLPILFMTDKVMSLTLFVFAIISFIAIKYMYSDEEFNSMWCYVSVGYIFTALFTNLIRTKQIISIA